MKKAFVLLLALAVLGGAVFAQEASISGYGQVKWGYNLNNNMHGFTNSYGLEIDLPLNTNTSAASTGEGVYGAASVTGVTINVSVDDDVEGVPTFDALDATLTAKIVAGDLTTTIYNKPSLSLNNASHFGPWKDDNADYSDVGIRFNPAVGGGLTFAYPIADLGTFTFKLASHGDATAYASDKYKFTGGIVLTPVELLTLTLGGGYDTFNKDIGATVKVALAPAEGITAYFAGDFYKQDAIDAKYDGRFNLAAKFGGITVGADVNYKNFTTVFTDVLDAKLSVSGTVDALTFSAAVFAMDLLADPANDPMFIGVAESISYKIALDGTNHITPYQRAVLDLSKADNKLYIKAGVNAALIPNTLFTLDYTAGTLTNKAFPNSTPGFVNAGTDADKGYLTFTAKVSF